MNDKKPISGFGFTVPAERIGEAKFAKPPVASPFTIGTPAPKTVTQAQYTGAQIIQRRKRQPKVSRRQLP